MATQTPVNLTLLEAKAILEQFNCTDSQFPASEEAKVQLRAAILQLAQFSDFQILGICAQTATQGYLALKTYAEALDYDITFETPTVAGPVYIKFNPSTGRCHLDARSGKYWGVLVSYQTSQPEGINEVYGHFPLDLFVSIP